MTDFFKYDSLDRHLEDDRAARRARAQARVAAGWTPPVPPAPPKAAPKKRLTLKQVDRQVARHRKMIEAMIRDAAADSGLDPDVFFVDIVRGYEASDLRDVEPIVRAEVLRGYGLEVSR